GKNTCLHCQAIPAIDKLVLHKGAKLNQQQRIELCKDVTPAEKAWPIVKDEVTGAVMEFFTTGKLYRAINCTAITLVPKVPKPKTIKEFRTIACCTILYKMISKILEARIQGIISTIINESQAGFIPGRKIADNILLAHELVKAYTRKNISPRCMIKIDLHKVHDSVEWPYMKQVMEELRFPQLFTSWVMECIQTVDYSIVVNAEPTKPFNAAKD
uniref:Uncharacterized protein LOC104212194 n=1 Tax=Nicotiana sylvestris TaxID=4096 RepID=A0A1U7VD07_NICSY